MPLGWVAGATALAAGASLYSGKESAKAAERGAQMEADAQQQALDYRKEVEAPVLEQRNKALPIMSNFYLDPKSQNKFINETMQSPFYQQMVDQGEQAIARNALATGGFRAGTPQLALAQNSQNVLNNMVKERMQGVASIASTPLNTNSIANNISQIGATNAAGQIAKANAMQQGYGNFADSIMSGAGMYAKYGM